MNTNERYELNKNLAQMLKGGVIMDVTTPEQAKIAEAAGACAVMALERLPADIRIQGSSEVPPDFHPRFTATVKTYEYRILNRTFADPTRRLNSYFWYGPLDVDAMRQAASYLVGTHDFKSFATAKPEVTDTVRTIYETSLEKEDDLIRFRITGNGFLYNMVRIITGTLLEVGKGDYPPEKVKEILAAKDRKTAGATARPEGLTLVQIRYPEWDFE